MWAFIGYGFKTYRALFWVASLTGLGVMLLAQSPPSALPNELGAYTAFVLDTLLPIIELDPVHKKIELTGLLKWYGYLLKTMGFILATFLGAGLSGLTKR